MELKQSCLCKQKTEKKNFLTDFQAPNVLHKTKQKKIVAQNKRIVKEMPKKSSEKDVNI